MKALTRLRAFLTAIGRRGDMDRAMDDEFALHLELLTADLVRRGLSPDEAARQARLAFGNVTGAKETARASHGAAWLDALGQDLRFALRTMRKNAGFTAVAVLSLGFGIGATTTLFSVIDALDFRPLHYLDAGRLVWLAEVAPPDDDICGRCAFPTAPATATDWVTQARSYDALAVVDQATFTWDRDGAIGSVTAGLATPGFFGLIGVRPVVGRALAPMDTMPGAEPVVLATYEFWQTHLGGDSSAVGTVLAAHYGSGIDPVLRPVRVIGVLPKDFRFMSYATVWAPMSLGVRGSRISRFTTVIGRLEPGTTIAAANAELETIAARLALAYPTAYRGWGASVRPLRDRIGMGVARGRFVLFAITAIVLLIAVLNVAGLLLSRAVARRAEFAMRAALGAGRLRLIRQQLVEGGCVGLAGGIAGVVFAEWGVRFTDRWLSIGASGVDVGVDRRMLAFAAAVSLVVGIAAAVVPALRGARVDFGAALRGRTAGGTAHGGRSLDALIAAQVGLALVLLTAATLLSTDFLELRYLDLGYDPHGLYHITLFGTREQRADPRPWGALAEASRARVAELSGVESASLEYLSAVYPQIVRPADDGPARGTSSVPVVRGVDPGYFTIYRNPLLLGRGFTKEDRRGAPLVAVVNAATAARYWPGQNPLSRGIVVGDSGSAVELLTVIGVVADAERAERAERHAPVIYRPFEQAKLYHAAARLYLRVSGDQPALFDAARAAVARVTGRQIPPVVSDETQLSSRLVSRRFTAVVLDFFAAFGLLLAAMGIYASIAYAVTRRSREIGIRIALGAERRTVLGLVARRGVVLAIGGVSIGAVGALALTRTLRAFVAGTSVTNPWVFAGSACLMIAIALAATIFPARRATRIDPVIALRSD